MGPAYFREQFCNATIASEYWLDVDFFSLVGLNCLQFGRIALIKIVFAQQFSKIYLSRERTSEKISLLFNLLTFCWRWRRWCRWRWWRGRRWWRWRWCSWSGRKFWWSKQGRRCRQVRRYFFFFFFFFLENYFNPKREF